MKKNQRARLTTLKAKPAAELNSEEQAELATLEQLATQYPDPAQDTEEDPAKPSTAPADCAAAPVAAAAAPTGLAAAVANVITAARSRMSVAADLTAARATLSARDAALSAAASEITALKGQLATQATTLAAAIAATAQLAGYFGVPVSEIATKSPKELTALADTKIAAEAARQLASAGVDSFAASAPLADASRPGGLSASAEEFRAMSPSARATFRAKGGKVAE